MTAKAPFESNLGPHLFSRNIHWLLLGGACQGAPLSMHCWEQVPLWCSACATAELAHPISLTLCKLLTSCDETPMTAPHPAAPSSARAGAPAARLPASGRPSRAACGQVKAQALHDQRPIDDLVAQRRYARRGRQAHRHAALVLGGVVHLHHSSRCMSVIVRSGETRICAPITSRNAFCGAAENARVLCCASPPDPAPSAAAVRAGRPLATPACGCAPDCGMHASEP